MTSTPTAQRLLDLLPSVYRLADAENGGVLRELLEVVAEQFDAVADEIDQLYDDQFIETCARWVAPYLGDLIGYRVLHGVVPEIASPRAEVANTIAYRRRKGTASVLEQLARDVTGWPARAVEYFERVATTQSMFHPRPHAQATVDLRNHQATGWLAQQNAAFDDFAHTADVRRINASTPAATGRHNIANVGLFLWRTEAVALTRSPLIEHGQPPDGRRFRFDPLGTDAPLFGLPRTEDEITHLAEPFDGPLRLGRRWLSDHVESYYPGSVQLERQIAGAAPSAIGLEQIRISDLSDTTAGAWAHEPPADKVAVDPVLGRVFLGTAVAAGERLLGTFAYGQAVPVGAGASSRRDLLTSEPVREAADGASLQTELTAVASGGTVRILDSDRYSGNLTITTTAAPVGQPETVVHVVAADHARPSIAVPTALRLNLAPRSTVVLDGLLISGGPLVLDEIGDTESRTVILRNCTFVPGHSRTPEGAPKQPDRASLLVLDPFAHVVIERSVLGPIVAVEGSRVELTDCIVDASSREGTAVCGRPRPLTGLRTVTSVADMVIGDGLTPGGEFDLHESTVVGTVHCTQLDASNSILLGLVTARRRQVGCVRFSFVPLGSRTGKKFRCQPDGPLRVVPRFTSLRFGDPAYLQLSTATSDLIRRGADDESEMGVTHLLFTPQRESNLLLRLDEYLRFGLEAGYFYAT